ncbi:hypothetical protein JOB18_016879 [Solea senegalensis]|uniref:Uncharacterized protein n=1 Tax=Solea senegalensis TaxID=28829 RepID=A0AAV6S2N2_SOLSE|nr:hypothetical protein JOB18_016879 [Solea senegalensis]
MACQTKMQWYVVSGLNLPAAAVYICRGGKPIQGLAVLLEWSIISSSDSATVSPPLSPSLSGHALLLHSH